MILWIWCFYLVMVAIKDKMTVVCIKTLPVYYQHSTVINTLPSRGFVSTNNYYYYSERYIYLMTLFI